MNVWQPGTVELDGGIISTSNLELAGGTLRGNGNVIVAGQVTNSGLVSPGLSAGEILGRLRASPWWLAFYLVFVASVAVHAPLGLRAIVAEWLGWRGRFLDAGIFLAGTVLLALGLRAIAGLFGGPA